MYRLLLSCALLTASAIGIAHASDLAKEKRWADQIVDALLDGEAEYISDGTSDFLAIVTESSDETSKKAAIVMHGSGVHPDWPTVVQPLRVGLTEHGWHTVSIQMPILANEATSEDYTPIFPRAPARIDATIRYLREEMGVDTVVLVAHSLGAAMTTYYLSSGRRDVAAFVAIGLGPGYSHPDRDTTKQLTSIDLPLLDLFGSEDLEGVVNNAEARRTAQAANSSYTQIVEAGADHFFDGEEEALIEHVTKWLQRF